MTIEHTATWLALDTSWKLIETPPEIYRTYCQPFALIVVCYHIFSYFNLLQNHLNRRGGDRIEVRFTTTYAISA
jgi:hypothetical protein